MSKIYQQRNSSEPQEQVRKSSIDHQGQLRKISQERSVKDPIDILKLNKKVRNKEQLSIVSQYLKQFPNFKIIQNENNYNEKIIKFLDKITYQKVKKGEFVFHNQDKNDFYYFILSGEISTYAKKSQLNLNRSLTPPNQAQNLGTQSTSSPQSSKQLEKSNVLFQQQVSNFPKITKQSSQSNLEVSPSITGSNDEEDDYELLKLMNDKIGQYFEREGQGRLKYNRISVLKDKQCFGDLSKKFKSFSAVARSDQVELLTIQNADFTNIFDFFEKKIEMTTLVLRKQFEGLVSNRILVNLAYLFEDDGEVLTAGEYVYRESDAIDKLYIVKDGHLDLVKKVKNIKNKYVEKKISIISTGELFGYESLQNNTEDNNIKSIGENQNLEEEGSSQQKETINYLHTYGCKSTTERASIYWLDLKALRKRDDYEEFFNHLNRLGVKKQLYYEERLQKMIQIEEKQHTDQSSLSPSKQAKINLKENGQLERKSTNVFDFGISPSQKSLNVIEDQSSPLLRKKSSQNREKSEQTGQSFQFKRNSSLVVISINQNSSNINNDGAYPEQTPEVRKKAYNQISFGNGQQAQSYVEVIPENDELFNSTLNQTKFQFQKKKIQSFHDEFQNYNSQNYNQEGNIKLNLNSSKNSFNSTNDLGFQLKPIYNSSNNFKNNNRNRSKQDNFPQEDSRQVQASPFSSPVKLRKMRNQQSLNSNTLNSQSLNKAVSLEKENQSKRNIIKIGSNNQIIEEFSININRNQLKISSYDTPEEYEEQIKQQIKRKLIRQDSGRLLQRKRENEYLMQNPSNIDLKQVQEILKIKEDIVSKQAIPKIVQLAASGLPTFEESERIQRVLKQSNQKSTSGKLSISAVNNMTRNPESYSPRNLKKGSTNNSPNASLNASISRIMKNRVNMHDLNESQASYENISKNEINSPMKIKSFQKLNFFEEDDSQMQQISFQNLKQNQNSSPLISINQNEKEIDENDQVSNIFKYTCESPRLKLQLRQTSPEPSLDLQANNLKDNNQKQILLSPGIGYSDNFTNFSEIQDTINQNSKQNQSNEKFIYKKLEKQQQDNLGEIINKQKAALYQLSRSQSEKKQLKCITAKLQEATRAQPNKNISLINSLANRRHSSIMEDAVNNSKLSNNLFPQFLNNRASLINSIAHQDNILQKNTRSSSGSQKDNKEQAPLVLKPLPESIISQQSNSCQTSPSKQPKVTLQVELQKPRQNKDLTFNQNLLKKSLIRQKLHKKYSQIISNSPYRDKIILVQEANQNSSQQNSQFIDGVSGQTINESPIKQSKNKIFEMNNHFMVDPQNIFPQSLENSKNISLSIHNPSTEYKMNHITNQGQTLLQKYQQQPLNKSVLKNDRFSSTQRLRNLNSLHQIGNLGNIDQDYKNKFLQQPSSKNLNINNMNISERYHLAPLQSYTTAITNLPARQASLQSLQHLVSFQQKQDLSSKNLKNVHETKPGKSTYQNINQLLKPINLSESTFREKKVFSVHANII